MELIINAGEADVSLALLDDRKLIELHKEKRNAGFAVGDIYLGKIKKVMPGLNAVFVDVGHDKDAFLHYLDLGPQFSSLLSFTKSVFANPKVKTPDFSKFKLLPDIDKGGKITQLLSTGDTILVQIAKEPISNKGPRITTELSIPGRYVVLTPFSDKISISQKIKTPEEKDRLKKIVSSIRPKNFGVIVRTVAEHKGLDELQNDLEELIQKWYTIFDEAKVSMPPVKVLGELDRTSAILRDLLNSSFSNIYINDLNTYEELKHYLKTISPDKVEILKHYKGKEPIFDYFGIDKQIKASFGKTVNFKGGAYLIIEHTEAMHVIDVNSGHRQKSDSTQENNALEVNLEAATEIARQLRLRDMGGIIVIDFIDLHSNENRKLLFEKLKAEMKSDRAKHTILPPTKFGLVQITRQRVRPQTDVVTSEKCPTCNGNGEIQASILLDDEIENNLKFILKQGIKRKITIAMHPFIASYFTKGIISKQMKWFINYKNWVKIRPVQSYSFLEYRFFDGNDDEIRI